MKLWAFGTSPYGLGLTPEAFWSLTPWEFECLRDVYDEPRKRWAISQADLRNINNYATDGAPWLPEDFLHEGNRAARVRQAKLDNAALIAEKLRLRKMKPGDPPAANIPDWAFGRAGRPKDGQPSNR